MALTIEELEARLAARQASEVPAPREGDLTIEEVESRPRGERSILDPEGRSEFSKGIQVGKAGMQSGIGGFVSLLGNTMGSMDIEQLGYRITKDAEQDASMKVAPRAMDLLEDVKTADDFYDWMAQGIGQLHIEWARHVRVNIQTKCGKVIFQAQIGISIKIKIGY